MSMGANHEQGDDRRRRRWLLVLGGAVLLVAAGVGVGLLVSGGDDESKRPRVTTTTEATAAPTTTTTVLPEACVLPGGGVEARDEAGTGPRTILESVGIRAPGVATAGRPDGLPDCAESVVLAFNGIDDNAPGIVPGLRAEYRDGPVIAGPSGEPVDVAGSAFLIVRLEPAQNHTDDGVGPVAPQQVLPDAPGVVLEVREIEDFEGIVTYAIGLDRRVPFAVGRGAGSTWWISFVDG